jgi:hypothetical protein
MRPELYTEQAQQNTNAVPLASEINQYPASGLGFLHANPNANPNPNASAYGNAYGNANSVTPVYNSNIDQNMRSPQFFGTMQSGGAIALGLAASMAAGFLLKDKQYAVYGGCVTLGLALGGYLQSR